MDNYNRDWYKNENNRSNKNLNNTIAIIIGILAISIYLYKFYKEETIKREIRQENINQYTDPELKAVHEKIEELTKKNGIQIFNLEVVRDENETVKYYFQFNSIYQSKVDSIQGELHQLLEQYQHKNKKEYTITDIGNGQYIMKLNWKNKEAEIIINEEERLKVLNDRRFLNY